MMTIARLTHRYYKNRTKKPHECQDHVVGYYTTIEKARATAKDFLGENATVDNDFGFDIWVSPNLPLTEYIIDLIAVY
jgi:hypothetical protein